MRVLAWDDEKAYTGQVLKHLNKTYGIETAIEKDEGKFMARIRDPGEKWDFVLTDLAREKGTITSDLEPGLTIAKRLASEMQVFIVTKHYKTIDKGQLGIPANVIVKSKSLHAIWMAEEIVADLRRQGLYSDAKKVFLIYGHDGQAPGLKREVEHFLEQECKIKLDQVKSGNLRQEIMDGLVGRMSDCAAFVAICTPDDDIRKEDGTLIRRQPRQNVLLEMGLATGLGRGIDRLVILQKWGPSVAEQAHLPSDLGGVIPIQLLGEFAHHKQQLKDELLKLGLKMA